MVKLALLGVKLPPPPPKARHWFPHPAGVTVLCPARVQQWSLCPQQGLIRTGNWEKRAGLFEEPPLFGINLHNSA